VKRFLIMFAALAASAGAAHACQCEDPAQMSAKEQAEAARWIAEQKIIIAEVVRLPGSPPQAAERYRVVRQIVGDAPDEIIVLRHITYLPDGQMVAAPISSCDYSGAVGQQTVMAFTPRGAAPPCGVLASLAGTTLRAVTMCTQFNVQNPAILAQVRRLSRR
jgi:hypothetical protein